MAKDMLPKVGRYQFLSEPFHCDFSNHLFMGHLGNSMLNAAGFHAEDRYFGMSYLNSIHRTWVLSRMAIEMDEMPLAHTEFDVETWIEAAMKYFTSRNFKILSRDGSKVYGYGRSIWAMINTDTRQPVDLLSIHDGVINDYVDTETQCPIAPSSRVKMSKDAEQIRSIQTYYNDVDVNGHVNSIKYIEHVLDLFDLDWYRNYRLKRFEIAYVAESHQGDKLHFYKELTQENEYAIRITKGVSEEVEVVRCLVKFVKE